MNSIRTIVIKTNHIPPYIKESMERKEMIKLYLKGKISKEALTNKGITFATPV